MCKSSRIQRHTGKKLTPEPPMRRLLSILFFFPALLSAQGWILPRPCPMQTCPIAGPCFRCDPRGPSVVRQSSDVSAELVNGVLHYEVTETFVNSGDRH